MELNNLLIFYHNRGIRNFDFVRYGYGYIPFESPSLIDFRYSRFDLIFWRYVMPCGAMLCKLVLSGSIAA